MKKIILRSLIIVVALLILVWIFGYNNTIGWILRRDYEVFPGTGIQFPPCIVLPLLVIAALFVPFFRLVGVLLALWFLGLVIKWSWTALVDYGIDGSSPIARIAIIALVVSVVIVLWGAYLKIRDDA